MSERAIGTPAHLVRRSPRPIPRFAVQVAVGLGMMVLGVFLSFAGLYSDIGMLYTRDQLWLHRIPYIDYPLEYPVGIGMVNWFAALVTGRPSMSGSDRGAPSTHTVATVASCRVRCSALNASSATATRAGTMAAHPLQPASRATISSAGTTM